MIREFRSSLGKEKEHTAAACLTCGRGLEEEVRDHAKVRGLLVMGEKVMERVSPEKEEQTAEA